MAAILRCPKFSRCSVAARPPAQLMAPTLASSGGTRITPSVSWLASVMRRPDESSRLTRGTVVARSGACSLLDGTASPSRRFRNNFDNGIGAHGVTLVIYLGLHRPSSHLSPQAPNQSPDHLASIHHVNRCLFRRVDAK